MAATVVVGCNNVKFVTFIAFAFGLLQIFSQLKLTEVIIGPYASLLSSPVLLSLPMQQQRQDNNLTTTTTLTTTSNNKNNLFLLCNSNTSMQAKAVPPVILRNIHLVMVGDSFMRYQYLSLAYRLRYGVWFEESLWYYNLVKSPSFESPHHPFIWAEFLLQTNKILQPLEVCDCFRRAPNKYKEIYENRYFYDPIHNNSIIFLLAFGHIDAIKGRLLPRQIRNVSSTWQMQALKEQQSLTWIHRDWANMITGYIRALDPPPQHVIMNAGMWRHKFGWARPPNTTIHETMGEMTYPTKALLRSIKRASPIQFGWRTTTYLLNRTNRGMEGDELMCKLLPICINVSFTRYVKPTYYWDGKHFLEPVYRAANEEMLDMLGYLPNNYVKLNLSQILE